VLGDESSGSKRAKELKAESEKIKAKELKAED
jgi:hypothetical protein